MCERCTTSIIAACFWSSSQMHLKVNSSCQSPRLLKHCEHVGLLALQQTFTSNVGHDLVTDGKNQWLSAGLRGLLLTNWKCERLQNYYWGVGWARARATCKPNLKKKSRQRPFQIRLQPIVTACAMQIEVGTSRDLDDVIERANLRFDRFRGIRYATAKNRLTREVNGSATWDNKQNISLTIALIRFWCQLQSLNVNHLNSTPSFRGKILRDKRRVLFWETSTIESDGKWSLFCSH